MCLNKCSYKFNVFYKDSNFFFVFSSCRGEIGATPPVGTVDFDEQRNGKNKMGGKQRTKLELLKMSRAQKLQVESD